ncbi:MAG: hypothetical protein KIT84_01460 [Labilithrix sp.]|nr:hypothetical protein [Labilithrix sp.]MCW5809654.1 hypothetical protein [Labilithrix sp.]
MRNLLTALVGFSLVAFACGGDEGAPNEADPSAPGDKQSSSGGGSSSGSSGDDGTSGGPNEPGATDGIKNGSETDVDCGGPDRPKCADGKTCAGESDCESGVCKDGTCKAPSADDEIKNGDETDVDCGGSSGKKCAVGKTCSVHADCESDGCDFAKKCAVARSCTAESGGQTCGEGAVTAANKKHESCCKSLAVPRPAGQGGPYFLDKYLITAGRMRTFIERTNGNPRAFVSTLPEGGFVGWKRAWDSRVPDSLDAVHIALGQGGDRAGCDLNQSRARTYWMSNEVNAAQGDRNHPANSQETLDAKVLNCVPIFLLYALCAWDGARLPSAQEVIFAWRSDENRNMPWGNTGNNATRSSDNLVHFFPDGFQTNWVHVPEPGRYPAGYGKYGHADLVGSLFHMTRDINAANTQFARVNSGSWEPAHNVTPNTTNNNVTRAYWAFGGRCSRPAAN